MVSSSMEPQLFLFCSGAFAWRRAHLEEEGALVSSDAHQERSSCQIQR
jgi:hypothetical protein